MSRAVVWFSCGAASAIAAMYAVKKYDNCDVVYCDNVPGIVLINVKSNPYFIHKEWARHRLVHTYVNNESPVYFEDIIEFVNRHNIKAKNFEIVETLNKSKNIIKESDGTFSYIN